MLDVRCLNCGLRIADFRFWILDFETWDLGLGTWDFGLEIGDLGLETWDLDPGFITQHPVPKAPP